MHSIYTIQYNTHVIGSVALMERATKYNSLKLSHFVYVALTRKKTYKNIKICVVDWGICSLEDKRSMNRILKIKFKCGENCVTI